MAIICLCFIVLFWFSFIKILKSFPPAHNVSFPHAVSHFPCCQCVGEGNSANEVGHSQTPKQTILSVLLHFQWVYKQHMWPFKLVSHAFFLLSLWSFLPLQLILSVAEKKSKHLFCLIKQCFCPNILLPYLSYYN